MKVVRNKIIKTLCAKSPLHVMCQGSQTIAWELIHFLVGCSKATRARPDGSSIAARSAAD